MLNSEIEIIRRRISILNQEMHEISLRARKARIEAQILACLIVPSIGLNIIAMYLMQSLPLVNVIGVLVGILHADLLIFLPKLYTRSNHYKLKETIAICLEDL